MRSSNKIMLVKRHAIDENYERKRPFTTYQSDYQLKVSPPPAPLEPLLSSEENPMLYDFEKFTWLAE